MGETGVHAAYAPDTAGSFIELGTCASNWHIALTNISASAVAFRMEIGNHYTSDDRSHVHVGIGWNATPAELTAIQANFRQAAWWIYAMSAGTYILRDYDFYNNANQCDDGSSINTYACSGTKCDICLAPSTCPTSSGRSETYNNGGLDNYIAICQASGDAPGNGDWYRPWVLAHEWGHYELGLPDEYSYTSLFTLCRHTIMASFGENQTSLCNNATHRSTASDIPEGVSILGPWTVLPGGGLEQDSHVSGWAEQEPTPYSFVTSGTGPPMHAFSAFFSNTTIGHP